MAAAFIIDPATIDFSGYSHLVGNNEFDADMIYVESFVQAYQQPENKLIQSAVFNYYISQLLSYWNFTKEYLQSDKILEDLKKVGPNDRQDLDLRSPEVISEYEEELLENIQDMTDEFAEDQKLNISYIQEAFKFITRIACLYPEPSSYIFYDNIYPLPNIIGLFGLNTYLYAYFEEIYLVGVPTRAVNYDTTWGCPETFIDHDIQHSNEMEASKVETPTESSNQLKIIYYTILNDPNLTMKQRECHITNIWIYLHELDKNRTLRITASTIETLIGNSSGIRNATGEDFYPLYESFRDFTLSKENIQSISEALKFQEFSPYRKSFRKTFKKKITKEAKLDLEDRFDLHYIMSYWYTLVYIDNIIKHWSA